MRTKYRFECNDWSSCRSYKSVQKESTGLFKLSLQPSTVSIYTFSYIIKLLLIPNDDFVSKYIKLRQKILAGNSDRNIHFSELRILLIRLGFEERIKGSHHIFTRSDITEIVNLQPKGIKAKSYQVKQVRRIIIQYELKESDTD